MAANPVDVLQPTVLLSIELALLLMIQQLCIQNKGSLLTCQIKLKHFNQITLNTI
jgi:hypothetical protein